MALCVNGGEVIERDQPSGRWRPDSDAVPGSYEPHEHCAPRLTVAVEPIAREHVPCVACAWGSNYATLRVGEVDVCDDHAVSAIKLQHAMMAR
jgi:hypothetical protein